MIRSCMLPVTGAAQGPASHAAYLAPVPRPPHDPWTLLLNGQLGWRMLPGVPPLPASGTIAPLGECGALRLLPQPGSGRSLLEAGGSFGGLVLPQHMALATLDRCAQVLLLFDARGRRLRRFDPCLCAFVDPFCMRPDDTRLPAGAAALASSCGRLYLADPAGRRVIVLNAATGALRARWQAPLAIPAGQLDDWQPAALASAANGDIWVGDRMNGLLLRFSPSGSVREIHPGFGAVSALAATCDGRLLITSEAATTVVFYDPQKRMRLEPPLRPADIVAAFPPLPLSVHGDASVDLCALCDPACVAPCVFDPSGMPLDGPPFDPAPLFPAAGLLHTDALDSGISECIWDRIVLSASVPPHCSIAIDLLSAETLLPPEEVVSSDEWKTARVLTGDADTTRRFDGFDFMLQAPAGRYLWLRLRMNSNGSASPELNCIAIDFPRISWRRYLPAIFGSEPVSAEFTDRWLAIFDRQFRGIEAEIDTQARLFDPLSAPAGGKQDFLGFLAGWVGLSAVSALPLARRRAFIKSAPAGYGWRGTPRGLTRLLYLFFGLERWCDYSAAMADCVPCATVIAQRYRWRPPRMLLEHYVLRRWLWLGFARLSDNAKLWGERIVNRSRLGHTLDESARLGVTQLKTAQDPFRDPFHVYAHTLSVFVPAACLREATEARALSQLLKADVPAHVRLNLVPVEPRFRIGVQAMLGLDAVIGYRAATTGLGEMKLGKATVLGGEDRDGGARSLRIGTRRVGMDTTLQ